MQKFCRLFVVLIAACAAAQGQDPANGSGGPPNSAVAASDVERYRIGYQDVLNVVVYKHPDLNQTVAVNTDGTIQLPKIDRPLTAVCKTEEELAQVIKAAYMEKHLRNPTIRVSVADQKSQPIGILGAVEKPATYYINRPVHLLEMLALAGGMKKEAGTRLVVTRSGNRFACSSQQDASDMRVERFSLKIRDVREGNTIFWLKPGDVVSVLDADIVYVYGNVNRQGSFNVREPITLRQALVNAEGLKGAARKDKIRILRQREGTQDFDELIYDLGQIDKGKVKDPYLQHNDIVAVSEDGVKSILLGITNALKGAAPNVIYRIPMP